MKLAHRFAVSKCSSRLNDTAPNLKPKNKKFLNKWENTRIGNEERKTKKKNELKIIRFDLAHCVLPNEIVATIVVKFYFTTSPYSYSNSSSRRR